MPKYKGICPPSREVDVYTDCPFDCLYCVGAQQRQEGRVEADQAQRILSNEPSNVPVYASPWTDPYPQEEEQKEVTRAMLKGLAKTGQPFFVITRNPLVERDKDVFINRSNAFIAISLNTLDDAVASIIEPKAPKPSEKTRAIENLIREKTIRVVVRVDPIIPELTDGESLNRTIAWLCTVKPFAVCFETLRLDASIADRLKRVLPNDGFQNMLSYYPNLGDEPVHPNIEWRLSVFKNVASSLEQSGVKAAFCRASLPKPLTKWDCRGGFDH